MQTVTTNAAANDTTLALSTRGAGRDVMKAINTVRKAVAADNFKQARNAARYAWPRLSIVTPIPSSDDVITWGFVARVLDARVALLESEAVAMRTAFAD